MRARDNEDGSACKPVRQNLGGILQSAVAGYNRCGARRMLKGETLGNQKPNPLFR